MTMVRHAFLAAPSATADARQAAVLALTADGARR
jgi:hypothetical protein